LIPYLDDFDPSSVCEPYRSTMATHVVPPLLASLSREGFDVLVSRDLASKMAYNRVHADDPWLTKLPILDPQSQPHATPDDVICCYLDHGGELVGSMCVRLLWCEPSFGAAIEDLSLLYADPVSMAGEDEFVICQPAAAWEKLRNVHIAMMAGGHVRKDFRKTIAYDGLWRLTRILAFVSWRWTYCLSLMEPDAARKIGFKLYGHQEGSPGIYFGHGNDLHPYLLYLSDRDHVRNVFCRPEAGDLSRGVGDLTLAELREAQRRGEMLVSRTSAANLQAAAQRAAKLVARSPEPPVTSDPRDLP
jgi:hypothetical protein